MQTKILKGTSEQIRHGLQYIPRDKQPSMYDILSWEHDPLKGKEWLIKMREDYREPKITEPQIYEKPVKHVTSPEKYDFLLSKNEEKHLKPHQIKSQLYYYGQDKEEKSRQKSPKAKKGPSPDEQKKKEEPKLNQFNQKDKRQIKIRKQNIKDFKFYTRDLPDSAFTTYFGKPAFAHYGSGAQDKSIVRHKSHSVMPHAGRNHPQSVQSHAGALSKANVINLQSKVPRKPTENHVVQHCSLKLNEYYNVEIVKPDLVNEVKFSNEDKTLKHKARTPRHGELNYVPKRVYPPPLHAGSKNKKKKQIRAKTEEKGDGLTFMDRRDKFMEELNQKKKVQSRIAYKPTECYWENQTQANSKIEEKWNQMRPAGVSSVKYLASQSPFLTR